MDLYGNINNHLKLKYIKINPSMSHKLISDKAVVYNAATLDSSYLTIVPNQIQFLDNEGNGPFGGGSNEHQVQIAASMFANFGVTGSNGQTRVDGYNYTLTEEEWDTFFTAQSYTSSGSYDQVVEAGLLYVLDNISPVFGLSQSNWVMTGSAGY
jgi:hypothetical protein